MTETTDKPKHKHICTHPLLHPTQWNEPKPDPAEMVGCCDMNQCCPVCGYGWVFYPCGCMRKEQKGQ